MLYIVLVVANRFVRKYPNGNNGQNKKGNDNTKDCHILNFICVKVTLFSYFVQTWNLKGVNRVERH